MRPVAISLPLLLLIAQAHGAGPTAEFLAQRAARLQQTARTLNQAGIPGYAVAYTRNGQRVRPTDRSGAMLVATVDGQTKNTWYQTVGQHSIGFMTSAGCSSQGPSSGYLRIGSEFMEYNFPRGSSYSGVCDITQKSSQLTEATFMVSPEEMKAFRAFYYARSKSLIKNTTGCAITPQWAYPGHSNLKQEGCAGAASSALNPAWVSAFRRNLRDIKAYGQQNNIAALAEVPDNAAQLISGFIKRVGAKQQTDPRVLVRHHATSADMITVFNQNMGENPMQTLKWNREVRWYTSPSSGRRYRDRHNPNWNGLGYNHTIFDLAPGEQGKSTWNARRMSLSDFAGSRL